MSRIDEILAESGSAGIAHRRVGDIVTPVAAARGVKREQYHMGTSIPIIDQGQTAIAGYTDDTSFAVPPGDYIVFGDHTRAVKWVDFTFAPGADGTKVLRANLGIIPKFAYYAIANLDVPSRGYNRHWTVLRELFVSIPPIEVQRAVVRALDAFQDLKVELHAELEARTRQYTYYRDALLTFRDARRVRSIPLGDFGTIFGGLTGKSKQDFSNGNARFVSYMNVFNNISVDMSAMDFVRVDASERQRVLRRGDILFTGSSETAGEVAMSSVVMQDVVEPLYLNSFTIGFRPTDPGPLDPEFAKHLFRSSGMRKELMRTASGVTRFNVSKARLARVPIPIPPLADQRQIAGMLDKFDAIVNDRSAGLPGELAARGQQYEYYRERLLTFRESAPSKASGDSPTTALAGGSPG